MHESDQDTKQSRFDTSGMMQECKLERYLKEQFAKSSSGGVFLLSINNLSMIISSHGGDFADNMVVGIMERMHSAIPFENYVCRVDREHIGVVITGVGKEELSAEAANLHEFLQNYGCTFSVEPIHIISSIGVVEFPQESSNAKDAIDKAYIALDDARVSYTHFEFYGKEAAHEAQCKNQLLLANYIQTALMNNKLRLAYQPIIDRASGDIAWYECLLRIVKEDGSIDSAGPFIPVAERMGFIDLIDSFVLQLVIQELRNNPGLKLAFNLSNITVQSDQWLSMLMDLMAENENVASRMVIEITETADAGDLNKVLNFVDIMHEFGCSLALDDFGAGSTNFAQIRHLPLDYVKIDGNYIRDLPYKEDSKKFVKTLLEFTHDFNMCAIAEFVENAEIADILTAMKVDFMQGNYFSPAVDYRAWAEQSD